MTNYLRRVPQALLSSPGRVLSDVRAVTSSSPFRAMSNPLNNPRSFLGYVVNKGEYIGAAYMAGKINAQYGAKAQYNGVPYTYGAGVVGMVLGFVNDVLLGDAASPIVSHLNNVSTALVATHFAAVGAQTGASLAGKELQLGERGKATRFIAGETQTVLGEIPPAPSPGKYLDLNEINRLAQMHG